MTRRKSDPAILTVLLWSALSMMPCPAEGQENDRISPLYFGPNALPVPDMLDGRVSEDLYLELDMDVFQGFYGDLTETVFAKINIPLFSPRVNLSAWMPIVEFYRNTPASIAHFMPPEPKYKGWEIGNVYVSVDIHVFKEKKIMPDISVRAAVITASGDGEEHARYFDAPGYFFDASIGKSFSLGEGFFRNLRIVLNGGFLCWQVSQSGQNDAPMYGAAAILGTSVFELDCALQGYSGWIGNGDKPVVFKSVLSFPIGKFRPIISYEYGIRDYPYHHYRIGVGYSF